MPWWLTSIRSCFTCGSTYKQIVIHKHRYDYRPSCIHISFGWQSPISNNRPIHSHSPPSLFSLIVVRILNTWTLNIGWNEINVKIYTTIRYSHKHKLLYFLFCVRQRPKELKKCEKSQWASNDIISVVKWP